VSCADREPTATWCAPLSPDLDDFLSLNATVPAELHASDVDHVMVDAVVAEHVEDHREIVLRLPGTA
jgi:hypothetical protein